MNTSIHAEIRAQQRAIPPLIIQWLQEYGESANAGGGAERLYFSKKSKKALAKDVGSEVVSRLGALLDAYLIVADETVVTVGHLYKRTKVTKSMSGFEVVYTVLKR